MRNLDMDRVTSQLSRRFGEIPTATITETTEIEPGLARVICQLTPGNRDADANLRGITALFNGQASPIEGSFRPLAKDGSRLTLVGFVTSNREVKQLTKDVKAHMTIISKNVLMDEENSLWDVNRTPSGDLYISRQEGEDLSEIMASLVTPRLGIPTFQSIASYVNTESEYVAFATVDGNIRHGFISESSEEELKVLCRDSGEVESINPGQVIESITNLDSGDIIKNAIESAYEDTNGMDVDKMVEYYKKVYQYDPEYMKKVEDQIRNRAAA